MTCTRQAAHRSAQVEAALDSLRASFESSSLTKLKCGTGTDLIFVSMSANFLVLSQIILATTPSIFKVPVSSSCTVPKVLYS